MRKRLVFCFFIFIGLTANVQTVDATVSGKVLNQAGNPIASAILTLVSEGTKDTTDASGGYSITSITGTVMPFLLPQSERVTLNRGILDISMTNSSPLKVEIFDGKGALLKREFLPNAPAGVYRLNIAETFRSEKLLVVNASIGRRAMTFRCLPLQNGKSMVNSSVENAIPAGGRLAKIRAVSDTLQVSAANYVTNSVVITSYDTTVNITLDTLDKSTVTVQLGQTKQTIEGFGINNTYATGGLPLDHCFTTTGDGLGMSFLRIGMNSNGGVENGSDVDGARSRGAKIIGSTWSPPGNWKTNGNVNDGGHVKPEYYDQWADKIVGFAKQYKLYAMSIGNEPDFASCGSAEPCNGNYQTTLYTAEEMVKFIKVAGPKLQAAGVKVIAPEASEWTHIWADTSACCSEPSKRNSSDPLKCSCFTGKTTPCSCAPGKGYSYGKYLYEDKEAWAALDILGVHEYDSQRAEPWPEYVAEKDRKPVFQTEMSGVKWWPEQGPSTDISNGIAVAGWIHDAMVVGDCSAWLYWWWQAYFTDDNEGLKLKSGGDTKRHWTFGNYSKFVRPGYKRVIITGEIPKDVLLSAYKGDDGTVVVVAINKGAAAAVPITIAGGTAPASMTPWVTSASDNLKSTTAVTVSGGKFTAELGSKTVTTFVGK